MYINGMNLYVQSLFDSKLNIKSKLPKEFKNYMYKEVDLNA